MGHFTELCRPKMQEQPKQRQQPRPEQTTNNQSPESNQTGRVHHITEQSQKGNQNFSEDEEKFIDPESMLYLKELTEDWANINLIIQ